MTIYYADLHVHTAASPDGASLVMTALLPL